jgi:hypothetical protein
MVGQGPQCERTVEGRNMVDHLSVQIHPAAMNDCVAAVVYGAIACRRLPILL